MNDSTNVPEVTQPSPTRADIEARPWKYIGYRGFSEFAASNDNFFVVRQFNVLNVRVLLAMQDRLVRLEGSLLALDKQSSLVNGPDIHNGSLRRDETTERGLLLKEIQSALLEYSKQL